MGKQLDMFGQEVGLKELKRTKAEVFEDYNTFVDKFETKKTTDGVGRDERKCRCRIILI